MSAYLDIIFLLVVAVLIFARLRNVLGTRPEDEKPAGKVQTRLVSLEEFEKAYENVRREIEQKMNVASKTEEVKEDNLEGLDKVLYSIPHFSRGDFCRRCSKAFEMILSAFAARDEETLKMLTGKKLFTKFQEIIKQRAEEGITAETDLIKVDELCIEDAKISSKGIAQIVVKFVSEQINLLKNAAGEVIEGDENFVQKITDIWTFERDINSNSPVWLLVSTKKHA